MTDNTTAPAENQDSTEGIEKYDITESETRIIKAFEVENCFTSAQIQKSLEGSKSWVNRHLNALKSKGIIEIVPGTTGRSTQYQFTSKYREFAIPPTVAPDTAPTARTDLKEFKENELAVLDRLAKFKGQTPTQLREELKIPSRTLNRILKTLRDEGFIRKKPGRFREYVTYELKKQFLSGSTPDTFEPDREIDEGQNTTTKTKKRSQIGPDRKLLYNILKDNISHIHNYINKYEYDKNDIDNEVLVSLFEATDKFKTELKEKSLDPVKESSDGVYPSDGCHSPDGVHGEPTSPAFSDGGHTKKYPRHSYYLYPPSSIHGELPPMNELRKDYMGERVPVPYGIPKWIELKPRAKNDPKGKSKTAWHESIEHADSVHHPIYFGMSADERTQLFAQTFAELMEQFGDPIPWTGIAKTGAPLHLFRSKKINKKYFPQFEKARIVADGESACYTDWIKARYESTCISPLPKPVYKKGADGEDMIGEDGKPIFERMGETQYPAPRHLVSETAVDVHMDYLLSRASIDWVKPFIENQINPNIDFLRPERFHKGGHNLYLKEMVGMKLTMDEKRQLVEYKIQCAFFEGTVVENAKILMGEPDPSWGNTLPRQLAKGIYSKLLPTDWLNGYSIHHEIKELSGIIFEEAMTDWGEVKLRWTEKGKKSTTA